METETFIKAKELREQIQRLVQHHKHLKRIDLTSDVISLSFGHILNSDYGINNVNAWGIGFVSECAPMPFSIFLQQYILNLENKIESLEKQFSVL